MGQGGSYLDNENDLGRHVGKSGNDIDNDTNLERYNRSRSDLRPYRSKLTKKLVDLFFAKRELSG